MLGLAWESVGEEVNLGKENFSLFGQLRVRMYKFMKNVHFKVPDCKVLDISGVNPLETPRRTLR